MQAIEALTGWQGAKRMLSESKPDSIGWRIIGAFSLPKSSFRLPSAWVKIAFCGPNKFEGASRSFELKTVIIQKTQDPVWNQKFVLDVPHDAKVIDLEVYDRAAGLSDEQLSRARLKFSKTGSVHASFTNRSLIYGYDGM